MYAEQKSRICDKCNESKSLDDYYVGSKGYKLRSCKACICKRSRQYFANNKARLIKERADYQREYCKRYPEKKKMYGVSWAQSNLEKRRRSNRESYHRNPKVRLANSRLYFARRRNAVPPWLSKEQRRQMREFYLNCPEGYHVDHIVPLAGKNFNGLHGPWNLQYLPAKENLRKNNRLV